MTSTYVGDDTLKYEEAENNVGNGVTYLKTILSVDETKPFFYYARNSGYPAKFQDRTGRKYELTYSGGEFHLISLS